MMARRFLKLTHVASTIWFVICVGYLLILTLHQVGFNWWVIFSLSGHSVIVAFVLISLYLFALFRGVGGAQHIRIEHPFTSTSSYMGLYVAAPLLGGLAGVFGMMVESVANFDRFALGVALGTLGTTFCVWVVIDPMAGLIEMFLPSSREHRMERLAEAEALRIARQKKRDELLIEAEKREEREHKQWREILEPQAERLATLLANDSTDSVSAELEAADIGAKAWRLGGLSCMRQLRDMTMTILREKRGRPETDHVSFWWDGIGDWRRPSLG